MKLFWSLFGLVCVSVLAVAAVVCGCHLAKKQFVIRGEKSVTPLPTLAAAPPAPVAPVLRANAEVLTATINHQTNLLILEVRSCEITRPSPTNDYRVVVQTISIKYPEGWLLISMQYAREKYFMTMDIGTKVPHRYVSFWINPQSESFRQAAVRHARAELKQPRAPIGLSFAEELEIVLDPTEPSKLAVLAERVRIIN